MSANPEEHVGHKRLLHFLLCFRAPAGGDCASEHRPPVHRARTWNRSVRLALVIASSIKRPNVSDRNGVVLQARRDSCDGSRAAPTMESEAIVATKDSNVAIQGFQPNCVKSARIKTELEIREIRRPVQS